MKQKSTDPHVILVGIFCFLLGTGIWFYYTNRQNYSLSRSTSDSQIYESSSSRSTFSPVTPTPNILQRGAGINDIRYVLPQGWNAEVKNASLFLSPVSGGGYLSISVYDYPDDTGRREYYCSIRGVCITETYFTEMNIGNISGYKADALDNSGGGPEYFGAKGDMFYIIASYNPPLPNDFNPHYREVLNSLVF